MDDHKFGCCYCCTNRDDDMACSDCDAADGFDPDVSVIEISADGFMQVRRELLVA